MRLIIHDHPYHYEMQNVTMLFFPGESIQVTRDTALPQGEDGVLRRRGTQMGLPPIQDGSAHRRSACPGANAGF